MIDLPSLFLGNIPLTAFSIILSGLFLFSSLKVLVIKQRSGIGDMVILLPYIHSHDEISSVLQEWDIHNESRRTAALNRQREMYDVEKNAREYANSLHSKL